MKKFSLLCCLISVMISCQQNETDIPSKAESGKPISTEPVQQDENGPVIKFEKSEYNFGVVTEGDTVKYDFKFTNVGKKELLIANAAASCGCTVPSFPKEAIKPGESGVIKVMFNSKGKEGAIDKTVTITANTQPQQTMVKIIGKVEKK